LKDEAAGSTGGGIAVGESKWAAVLRRREVSRRRRPTSGAFLPQWTNDSVVTLIAVRRTCKVSQAEGIVSVKGAALHGCGEKEVVN